MVLIHRTVLCNAGRAAVFSVAILFGKKEDKTVTVEEIYQNQPDEKKK